MEKGAKPKVEWGQNFWGEKETNRLVEAGKDST